MVRNDDTDGGAAVRWRRRQSMMREEGTDDGGRSEGGRTRENKWKRMSAPTGRHPRPSVAMAARRGYGIGSFRGCGWLCLRSLTPRPSARPSVRVRGVHDGPHPFPICFLTIKQGGLGKDHWLAQYFGASLVGRPWQQRWTEDDDAYGDKMETLFLARPSILVALAWMNCERSMRMHPFVILW